LKLLVITEELPAELGLKGHPADAMGRYYNPDGLFEKVALIDWGSGEGWAGLPHDTMRLPFDSRFAAWLGSAQLIERNEIASEAQLYTGFPGLPENWTKQIKDFAPDVIRCYGTRWSAVVAVELKRVLGVKLVCSVHNTSETSLNVLNSADAVMAVSEAVATELNSNCGIDESRIQVIPNRVDLSVFTPEVDTSEGPAGLPTIISVARDVEQKNLDRLFAACGKLQSEYPDLKLVHIGKSDRDWSRYTFATHFESVPNASLPKWYGWADMLACPSLWEGFGIVIVEALACGCPVLASNRSPMDALVTEHENGALADPESETSIREGLVRLIGKKAEMAQACRHSVAEFASEAIEAREATLYHKVLEGDVAQVRSRNVRADFTQLVRLAGALKSHDQPLSSLGVSLKLLMRAPWRFAGYKALLRALLPSAILKALRGSSSS
jgi:glycosyltransferase involved in cell wall biosynthesis